MAKTPKYNRAHMLRLCAPVGELVAAKADEATDGVPSLRRFEMVAYTGGAIRVTGSRDPIVVDLAGIDISAKSRPIFRDHDVSLIVGHTESVRVEGSQLLVSGVVSGVSDVAREVIETGLAGFPWEASIGALMQEIENVPRGESVQVNGQTFEGPIQVARKLKLGEISFVALGADDNTSVRIAAKQDMSNDKEIDNMNFKAWLKDKGFDDEDALDDTQSKSLKAMYDTDRKLTAEAANAEAKPNKGNGPPITAHMTSEVVTSDNHLQRERERCEQINAAYSGLYESEAIEERDRLITDGATIAEARGKALARLRAMRPTVSILREGRDPQSDPDVLSASFASTAGVSIESIADQGPRGKEIAAAVETMAPMTFRGLMQRVIHASGTSISSDASNELMYETAVSSSNIIKASGSSTMTLPGILGDTVRRIALPAYERAVSVIPLIAAERPLPDFRPSSISRLNFGASFEEVGTDGELKHAQADEQISTAQLRTYGQRLVIDRKVIVNDDIGQLQQIPTYFGQMAGETVVRNLITLLLTTPSTFFTTANNNFLVGFTTALSHDSLSDAWELMSLQTDQFGSPISLVPSVLLVPSNLAIEAWSETQPPLAVQATNLKPLANFFAGRLNVVSLPHLQSASIPGSSVFAWYLLADPTISPAMMVGWLNGVRTPTIREMALDTRLGMGFNAWIDFSTSLVDPRAAVKMKGES